MMHSKTNNLRFLILSGLLILLAFGCRKERVKDPKGYPEEVADIMLLTCATTGCHDDNSNDAEGRLSLASWDAAFQGSRAGAAIVPFRVDQSYLSFFINTYEDLGITQTPSMPLNAAPLSREQVVTIQNWIANGAPNADGEVKFADNPDRAKIYVANQGCDQIAVMDRDSRLVMRYLDIGIDPFLVESPHYLKLSPDGRYLYVVFLSANGNIEKYDTRTDQLVARAEIGPGSWNTFAMSPDGRYAYCIDLEGNQVGSTERHVSVVDLDLMQQVTFYSVGGGANPHGSYFSAYNDVLYVTEQEGNVLYKFSYGQDYEEPEEFDVLDLIQGNTDLGDRGRLGPHEVIATGADKYAVTCQYADQVRFYDSQTDGLLATVEVGSFPSEMAVDLTRGLLFVTCMEDTLLNQGNSLKRGSVAVIDYNSMTLVKEIYTGYQPHGIAVDLDNQLVYVANRNANTDGPAPHHTTSCGGRNGYVTAIDLNSLNLLPGFSHELSVDPYALVVKD